MKRILLFVSLIVLMACTSVQTTFDYDKNADFTKYKTYAFSEETTELPINQLNRDRVLDAINNEMYAKGFAEMGKDPDVIVDVHIKGKELVTANASTTGVGYGRYGWSGGYTSTTVTYDSYTEGSMFITLVDRLTEKIIWQGVGTKTIDESASPEKRTEMINYSIKQIMTNYPPNITNK